MDKHFSFSSLSFSFRSSLSERQSDRVLFFCGVFLAVCEIYKQIFLYVAIYHEHYNWWFFPFQLCSLPMYLCLIFPFLKNRPLKTSIATFMQDFNLLGGIAALAVPEGFRGIHWTLTLHGYVWHILLILIGIWIFLNGKSDLSRRGFLRTLPIFALSCLIATLINIFAPGHGEADMFYISPYYPTTQIVFHDLALKFGIEPANLLYLLTICIGSGVIHCLFCSLSVRFFAILRRISK